MKPFRTAAATSDRRIRDTMAIAIALSAGVSVSAANASTA